MVLRNVVPRQGTEILAIPYMNRIKETIEKCSSPTGDGNQCHHLSLVQVQLLIEKCSSPTGDGNCSFSSLCIFHFTIEKCSSPTGDGNQLLQLLESHIPIEKCSSPTGDGNIVFTS